MIILLIRKRLLTFFIQKFKNNIYDLYGNNFLYIGYPDTDPLYLQTILRQIVFVRLQLIQAEENEKKIVENDLLNAWKVRNNFNFYAL